MIIKSGPENLDQVLLQYRNTPLGPDLDSPAKLLLNRNLRCRIPMIDDKFNSRESDISYKSLQNRQAKAKEYHDITLGG